jgi:tRNA(Ile)-lysidine synthase
VLTAHTQEDQAETLLLALLRGSGSRGLGAMRERRVFDEREGGDLLLVRPLLDWARRAETLEYCALRGVSVRADEMNEDEQFARVRVRRQLLPLLETFNPRAVETLARTAHLLGAEADALEHLAAKLLEEASRSYESGALKNAPPLCVAVLREADGAVLSYALRVWIKGGRGNLRRIEAAHVAAVATLLVGARGGRVAELLGGARVERRRGLLLFHAAEEARRE